jgi:hypothetical protein
MRPILPLLISSLVTWLSAPIYAAGATYHVTHQEILPGEVKWDYLAYEAARKRLFITRSDHVEVYDTVFGHVVGTIPDTLGVHGVALASEFNKGFTSNGRSDQFAAGATALTAAA